MGMLDKDTQRKIDSCKALQEMTIEDLVNSYRFRKNLGAYMIAQAEDRKKVVKSYKAMAKLGGPKGYKLPAHPIDRVINLSVGEFAAEFLAVVAKKSARPFAERQYIQQLGMQAYNLTVAQYVVEEYPELEPVLLPKSKAN